MKKTISQTPEIICEIAKILELNPNIDKESKVIPYAYSLAARALRKRPGSVNWDNLEMQKTDISIDISGYSSTRCITLPDEDYNTIVIDYMNASGVKKVSFAYLTQLVLRYSRNHLSTTDYVIQTAEIPAETPIVSEPSLNYVSGNKAPDLGFILGEIGRLYQLNTEKSVEILSEIELLLRKEK